jgi:adenylosuccinate lyase
VSTQVIPRDRHAMFFATLGVIASSIERLATEDPPSAADRSARSGRVFFAGQKGSSAMPHKRNPVLTENLTGLARMVRRCALPAMENVALWHERDISHSSVERMIGPDATVTLDFALARLTERHRQAARLSRQHAEEHEQVPRPRAFAARAAGADAGGAVPRGLYRLVQRNAMKVWEQGADFLEELELLADKVTAPCPRRKSARSSTWAITPSMSTRSFSRVISAVIMASMRWQRSACRCFLT